MLDKIRKYFRKPIGTVAISLGLFSFFGPKRQPYVFNFDRTVNIILPGKDWPVQKLLSPAEKQVYAQLGRPDCFRLIWDHEGKIKVRSVIEQEWKGKDLENLPPVTWVYLRRNEEISFSGKSFYSQPISDLVKVVIKAGDPELVKDMGNGLKQWTYYSTGNIYTIADDKIVGTQKFPAMGSFHK